MWSNITKMWNYDVNNSLEYQDFAIIASAMGYYPGYVDCTAKTDLPAANSAKPAA